MEDNQMVTLSKTARAHMKNPKNFGAMKDFDSYSRITGSNGTVMEIWLVIQNEKIKKISFVTERNGISSACGSIMTSLVKGKSVQKASEIQGQDIINALDGLPPENEHYAVLASKTLGDACQNYLNNKLKSSKDSTSTGATCETCGDHDCSASKQKNNESEAEFKDRQKLQAQLCRIKHKVVVLSGKGGVGKSTIAVNLAAALSMSGNSVGLLDVDIHGPSIPTMLGLEKAVISASDEVIYPAEINGIKVMSIGFLLRNQDEAVIWRGPLKMGVIKQFLKDVAWGDLDYLIIDSPPGTGDEPLSVCQLIENLDGAVIVTTPQKVASVDVRKSITFCRQLNLPVLGIVENMSGFVCPKCGEITHILHSGGGQQIADDMRLPFLGSIPIDPQIVDACDSGIVFIQSYPKSSTVAIMKEIVRPIEALNNPTSEKEQKKLEKKEEEKQMRIAIPLADGKLTMHFGHCGSFALMDVDDKAMKILKREDIAAPPHEPGLLPPWLAERGVNMIIAGGMGQRAQGLFTENGIKVIIGAPSDTPEKLVTDYMAGILQTGENVCDH